MAHETRDSGWALTYIDNPIETPEGRWEYGSVLARFAAMWADRIIASILSIPVVVALIVLFALASDSTSSGDDTDAAIAGAVIGYIGVSIIYDWITTARGGGPGKRWLNLKVIREQDGMKPRLGTAAIRVAVVWLLSSIPVIGGFLFIADCAWALGDRRQAVHDRIARTLVVKRNP
jgi:uncharacterized RDD family membrane protein YckC